MAFLRVTFKVIQIVLFLAMIPLTFIAVMARGLSNDGGSIPVNPPRFGGFD